MLLNTWLSAARIHFSQRTGTRRVLRAASQRSLSAEMLEARTLLTALVINPDNRLDYTNAFGGIVVDNAALGTHDSLVIEGISISATSGDALSINLSGKALNSLALESIVVTQYTSIGFNIDLTNITGLNTIAIEDITIRGTGRGLDLTLTNTDTNALTIDDSTIPGIRVEALNGADIGHGLITQSTVIAGPGFEGVLLNVNQGSADNFRIEDNFRISSPNRDFVRINSTNAPMDGLSIINNPIGNQTQGAGFTFRAEDDTFVQPMVLTNNSTRGELLETFVLDLTTIGLVFDEGATGKPFTAVGGTGALTGLVSSVVSADFRTLTLTFNDFSPGETLRFVIDIDRVVGQDAAIFGDHLIGADVMSVMTGNRVVAGQMIGDPNKISASQFAIGPGVAGNTQGIVLDLTNSPTTNFTIASNDIEGAPGHAILFDADVHSDMTGVVRGNSLLGSGRDGLHFRMLDSNFTGAVIDNDIQGNGGHGIAVLPKVSRTGRVEAVQDLNGVIITSTNHGLVTGKQIMLQGLVNDDPTLNHPANGLHTVTRIDNNRFRLTLVDGTAPGVRYVGPSGTWYEPQFLSDGSIRGLVTIDMQSTVPQGTIRAATNAGPIVITSPNHGLLPGQRVRVSNVAGNTAANGVHKITIIDANRFSLDATTGNGEYDTTTGYGTWTSNVVTGASNESPILITSPGHGLQTGEEVRVTGVLGNTAANGSFKVSVIDADTFQLDGSVGNSVYGGGGNWVRLNDLTPTGDLLPQRIGGNLIAANRMAGIFVDVTTGTIFTGDIVANAISANEQGGIHIMSHSFGLGSDLPLNPADPFSLPGLQDLGFRVNIGTSANGDGNRINQNTRAGIRLEALDYGTGSFQIRNNSISSTLNDGDPNTSGDGIVVRLTNDLSPTEAIALLAESVIDGNDIGVDAGGNEGNGLLFTMQQRTRIQDLTLTNTVFLNNALDGFHFERSEDATLNSAIIEKNRATNNGGDGFDIFAKNTVKNELDFRINENVINQNAQYGVRVSLQADARMAVQFDRNTVTGNGHTANGTGFHPNDGVANSNRSAGGVGILAFQEIGLVFTMEDTRIDNNIGDGFSLDAFNHNDVLTTNFRATNSTFDNNTLTGLRSHGTAFGSFQFLGSQFNLNGEDGVRIVSIDDKNDTYYRRRVGGRDIDVTGMANEFTLNGQSGVQLGSGVSATFGDGTITNSNQFSDNAEDGLKLTQHNSSYMDFLGRRRLIQANRNFFERNGSNGIDVGHDAAQEGGNTEHGDEVASDIHLVVNNAVIARNGSDGIEYLADDFQRISRVIGGGQDVSFLARSSMTVSNSRITNNGGRGIDILNRQNQDSYIAIINNDILSNGLEGIYVVNTAAHAQLQRNSADVLEWVTFDPVTTSPNIEIRVQDNLIQSNGNATSSSRVTIEQSFGNNDRTGTPVQDWIHNTQLVPGTLGGLVIRVGSADSVGFLTSASTGVELSQSGVDAEVWKNSFDGNFGADVYFDSFVSELPRQAQDNFDGADNPTFRWLAGFRDPLSRLDLSFRENTGNTLDVTNGFAFVDNFESEFKSRHIVESSAPNHGHNPLAPGGHWINSNRKRNATRTIGRDDNVMGETPGSHVMLPVLGAWSYDGTGTSTWRVESDFDFNNFPQTSPTEGYSSFFTKVILNTERFFNDQFAYQWDTGINTPSFTGLTPFSLARGDIFNVRAGEAPIQADELDDNNSFVSAYNMGVLAGAGHSVNARTVNGNLNLHVKGDRDYYRFTAAGTGTANINLNVNDTLGDRVRYLIYSIDPSRRTQEVPMFANADGTPQYFNVNPGGGATITANVVAGREYVIEVLGNETNNSLLSATGKSFRFSTTRSYSLSIDAPAGSFTGGGSFAGGGSGGGSAGGGGGGDEGGSGGGGWAGNLPGQIPTAAFVPVSPNPRSTSAGVVTLNFSEDVTGVDISDFILTRDTVSIPLTESMFSSVAGDATQYTLDLGSVTGEAGTYVVALFASGSGIRDTDNNLLVSNTSTTWIVANSVTTTLDTADTLVGDGLARDINGEMSLRAAVMESNASPGSDVIVLGTGTYTLTRAGRFEDDALFGDLDVKGNLTIRGVSAAATIINAADLDRVFHVFPGASLTLENLTVTGGEAFDGGGIFNEGTVILRHVNVIRNEAYNQGGGIFNAGILTVVGSSISENLAGSRGGAVNNTGSTSYLNTTISTNVAVSRGGGLFNEDSATSSLINVSMIANQSSSRGGGLNSESTISTRIGNSILERNVVETRVPGSNATIGREMFGGVSSLGFNTIQVLDSRFGTGASAGLLTSDKFGRDTTVTSVALPDYTNVLQYGQGNGVGFHALKPKGGAVDAGSNAVYPVTPILSEKDAIGNPRLIEGNGDGIITIDLGAVEHLVNRPAAIFTATPNPAGLNEDIFFDGRASTHPNPATGSIVKWEWDFDWNPTNLAPTKPLTDPTYNPTEYFTNDAEGSTATHAYSDPARTIYTVRLIVTDNFGNKGFADRTVVVGVPSKPVVQRPFAVTSDLTPEIRWQASPATYRLQVFNVTSGSRVSVLDLNNLTATSYTPSSHLTPGRYEVIVTSTNSSGSTASDSYFFDVTRLTIGTPTGSTFDVTPKFNWTGVPGTSRYDLWVNRVAPSFGNEVLRNQFISGTTFEPTTSLGLGTFTWWVRAYDADGGAGDWSVPKTFSIGVPSFTAPAVATMDTTPTFAWTDMNAPRYELWVNRVGGQTRIIHQTALQTNSFTPTTPLPNGEYEAWVRPLSADGEAGLWSQRHSFRMDYRVGPVTVSPIGITTDNTPTFTWQSIDGAAKYDLWVDNRSTGVRQLIRVEVPHVANASVITYTHPTFLLAGNYRWWVQAVSPTNVRTAWSEGVDFTVPVPSIITPEGPIATNLPLFTWSGVPEYVSYDLWVNNLTTGAAQVLRVQNITGTSYRTLLPLENGTFIAWVRGFDAEGNVSQWSDPSQFSISVGVGNAPRAVAPSGVVLSTAPSLTFSWQAGSNAITHEILVKRIDQSAQPIVINVKFLAGTNYTTTHRFTAGGTYRWWIRGLDVDGNGLPWSQPLDFRVVSIDSDRGLSPADPEFSNEVLPTVLVVNSGEWTDAEGVQSITAHPAGTIIQIAPESLGVIETQEISEISEAPYEDVAGIDSLMEDWAVSGMFMETDRGEAESVSAQPLMATPIVVQNTSEEEHRAMNLLMAGLVAGTVLSTRKRSDDEERMI